MNISHFISNLINESDRSVYDRLVSIMVMAINEGLNEKEHAEVAIKFMQGANISVYNDEFYTFVNEFGLEEVWDFMGRDEYGEKTYVCYNQGECYESYVRQALMKEDMVA